MSVFKTIKPNVLSNVRGNVRPDDEDWPVAVTATDGSILLEDDISILLLEDGASELLLE